MSMCVSYLDLSVLPTSYRNETFFKVMEVVMILRFVLLMMNWDFMMDWNFMMGWDFVMSGNLMVLFRLSNLVHHGIEAVFVVCFVFHHAFCTVCLE